MSAFSSLTFALFRRSLKNKQPSDIENCIKYLRYLRGRSLGDLVVAHGDIRLSLVQALTIQVVYGYGNAIANIVEMTVLCHELLASDDLEGPPTDAIESLVAALYNLVGLRGQPLEKVIKCLRKAHTRLPEVHDASQGLAYSLFMRFHRRALHLAAMLAQARFSYSANPEYMEEAILRCRTFVSALSPEDPFHLPYVQYLAQVEKSRLKEFGVTNDLAEAHSGLPEIIDNHSFSSLTTSLAKPVDSISMKGADRIQYLDMLSAMHNITDAAEIPHAIKNCRLLLASLHPTDDIAHHTAIEWVDFGRAFGHTSISTAYENAISLMQKSLVFAPTLEIQHFRLAAMRDDYMKLPLNYASYEVGSGRLKQAIEILERGRGLLWSEMRGLRTSIERLRMVKPDLADKFAAVNQGLEALTMSGSGSEGEGMDPFGRLVMKQRKLVEERDRLVFQIQTLPGFDSFLRARSFDTLRLKDQLLGARKKGLESTAYEDALRSVLDGLYDLVGHPVIEMLRKSRIPHSSNLANSAHKRRAGLRYFWSHNQMRLFRVKGEIRVIQALNAEVTSLIKEDATLEAVVGGLRHHRLVHFACHGDLEDGKPFNAHFKLHGDERLTLLDIAELTEESIADEGLHLAAAMQHCGFRSVVGTMWAMADTDGRDLARRFYKNVLSETGEAMPIYERSAVALRDAVKALRRKRGMTLERWVNFVHYGA
ncbi:hypothetical protein F5148DRAFT_1283913 [Russula earlei]|uniref:Uncharacterized protein n=1 Tax=Russula earlei TaxID=71964 RepID=A0ACC0U9Z3_9AGAM|nr:hypothetical protein F5148DRAFT_1283913 [Russula earlei]